MIGESLSHYTILEKLGEGGMGEVYLAEDNRLKRRVALKVLPPEMANDPERLARFKREAEAVASLNHPNIVTIHSVEEHEGAQFLTMEWVEGETLTDMLERGPLSLERVFELGIPLADAIAAAHDEGITHRDLKPANVMINKQGRVKILDFGLAKLHATELDGEAREAPTQALTTEGLAIGTVPYMSPEQVRGETVDHRTDIFSLGIVLFEMVTGKRPFDGKSGADLVSAILRDRPPSVTELQADLPLQLGRVIQRCLEKDPEKRFQTAKDVRNELDVLETEVESGIAPLSGTAFPAARDEAKRPGWLMPLVAVVALIALAGFLWIAFDRGRASTGPEDRRAEATATAAADRREMVVILPFDNLGQAEDQYFAAGISDEINGRLASVSGLGVISRKTAARYAETEKSVQQIGDELEVDYILEGTVRWARQDDGASRVRIAPELIRVSDDSQVWTEIYDREIDDIFQVQSEIAGEVIRALDVTLRGDEQAAIDSIPTDNLEAYQAYLRAVDYQESGRSIEEADVRATEEFERAIELDPGFVEAWAKLSRHHSSAYHGGWDATEERLAQAKQALEGAEAADPDAPITQLARGYYYYYGFKDYDRALDEFRQVAERLPNDPEVLQAIAYINRRQGRLDETIRILEKVTELDPQDAGLWANLAGTYRAKRNTEKTLAARDRVIELQPDNDQAYISKAEDVSSLTGDLEAAGRLLEQAPGNAEMNMTFGWINHYFRQRDYDRVIEMAESIDIDHPFVNSGKETVIAIAKILRDGKEASRPAVESALESVEEAIELAPASANIRRFSSGLYAFLGDEEAALREANLAIEMTEKDAFSGPTARESLATVYVVLGRHEDAIDILEDLMQQDYEAALTIHTLRHDASWDPLRDNPRFQALIARYS